MISEKTKKKIEERKIELHKDEKILYRTNSTGIAQYIIALSIFFCPLLFFKYIWDFLVLDYSEINYIDSLSMSILKFFCGIIILVLSSYYTDKTIAIAGSIYYITSSRIVQITGKSLFRRKIKKKEIFLKDVDHVKIVLGASPITIVQKVVNGGDYFTGEEKYYEEKKKIPRDRRNEIKIKLDGIYGDIVNVEIFEILVKKIPLIQHPHLPFIYLS